MSHRRRSKTTLGSLRGNLTEVAGNVQRVIQDATTTIWADDRADVYALIDDESIDVPSHWIIGTYSAGMPIDDIQDDLRAALRERVKNWILDPD